MSCEKTPRPTYFLPSRPAHVACLCLTCVACELRTVAPGPRLRQRDCESTQHGKSSRVCWTDGTDGRVQAAKGSGSGWLPLRGPHLSRQTLPPSRSRTLFPALASHPAPLPTLRRGGHHRCPVPCRCPTVISVLHRRGPHVTRIAASAEASTRSATGLRTGSARVGSAATAGRGAPGSR